MREFIERNAGWPTVFQLPTHASDRNAQGGIWSLVKREVGNLAAADLSQVTRAVRHELTHIQYRPRANHDAGERELALARIR